MTRDILPYLAGAMDSDGYFTIRRELSDGATNHGYTERVGLNQCTPQVPDLLRKTFGGCIDHYASSTPNAKPMYRYNAYGKRATNACEKLLPYLRIKQNQAKLLIELSETRLPLYTQMAYWFQKEFPNWKSMKLLTTKEVIPLMKYYGRGSVYQAVHHRFLLSTHPRNGRNPTPHIPALLIERLSKNVSPTGTQLLPPELVTWRQRIYGEIRRLNKIGLVS